MAIVDLIMRRVPKNTQATPRQALSKCSTQRSFGVGACVLRVSRMKPNEVNRKEQQAGKG
jgi:hypothetical protein